MFAWKFIQKFKWNKGYPDICTDIRENTDICTDIRENTDICMDIRENTDIS